MKAAFLTIFTLYLSSNVYVAYSLWHLMPANTFARIALIIILLIGLISPFLFFAFGESMPISTASLLYKIGTSWMIAFLYLFIFVLLIDVFKLSVHIFKFVERDTIHTIFRHNIVTFSVLVGCVGLLLIAGNIRYNNKKRVHLSINTTKNINPMRIVAVSDLHLGYTIGKKELQRWVKLINDEKPDMIVIAGDLIDNQLRPVLEQNMHHDLQKLSAPLGVYASTGNHEYISGIKESADFFKKAGITLIRDSVVEVNGVAIIGREDYSYKNRKDLNQIVNGISNGSFKLLLDHQPNNLNEAVDANIDLQISGHTHYGQVFPASLVTHKIFELPHGYKMIGDTHFYVSSGLGIWGGKFRIGTQSEYVVVDL